MTQPIQAVIFDCDGTLVDSETLSLGVLVNFVAEFGLEISQDEAVRRFAGGELPKVIQELEAQLGRPLPKDFLEEFRRRQLLALDDEVRPIPGAVRLLESIQLPYCVASNAPRYKIELCLRTTRLYRFFDASRIFSAYEVKSWKPQPDLFFAAASALRVEATRCAVVEDSRFGIEAGLAAGMHVFSFEPRRQHESPANWDDARVTRIRDLLELIPKFKSVLN